MQSDRADKIGTGLETVMRLFLGGLFVFSGVLKLRNPELFAIDVHNFKMVEDPWPTVIALTVPWLEVFCGLGLIARRCYYGSLVILAGSLFVFNIALASAWLRGLEISCGCFGDSDEITNYPLAIGRNIVLLGIAVVLVALDKGAWFWGDEADASSE